MFKNYLKTALRNFLRHKGYTALNVIGLAIGIAASVLILQYVTTELSYDNFHAEKERIYRVQFDAYHNGTLEFQCATAFPRVGPSMKEEFPEVEEYARLYLRYGGGVVRYNELSINEEYIFQADQSFLDVFSYELVEGDRNTALKEPNTAVISEHMVRKYFGEENPIGKRIKVGSEEDYEITGIIRSPENSHLKFNFLLSYPTLTQLWGEDFETAWGWYDFYTYIKVRPDTDVSDLESKFPDFIDKHSGREDAHERTVFQLQALEDIHLKSDLIQEARVNGNSNSVYFLFTIAIFILIIAWVNYVNLSTARALERAKEVGIRKAIGAIKHQLVRQFIFESLLLNFVAAAIAILLLQLALPAFNNLVGKEITLSVLSDINVWISFILLFLVGAFFSGLYPAFVLSSYKPVEVLKGKIGKLGGGLTLRKSLVIFQFAASVALISGTLVVYQQLEYMRNQDLGFTIDQTLVVKGPGVVANDTLYLEDYGSFRNAVLQNPRVSNVASSTEIPGNLIYWTNGSARLDAEEGTSIIMYKLGVDYDYIENYGHEIIAGRGYEEAFTGDNDSTTVILNRAAIEIHGFESPEAAINQQIRIGGDTLNIVGVIENHHQQGLKKAYSQIALLLVPGSRSYYSIKMDAENIGETLAGIQSAYKEVFPESAFDYFFLDTFFEKQYNSEKQFGKVFTFFASLAILVASLGLFGLSFFASSQRTKEVGIRKVLGSSVQSIFILLSREFLYLVLFGNVIGWSIAYFIMDWWWLKGFAFRTDIGIWVFATACISTLFLALITVSYQSIKAALSNPVEALRYE